MKRAKLVARIEVAVTDTSIMDGMMEQLKAKKSATMGHRFDPEPPTLPGNSSKMSENVFIDALGSLVNADG